MTRLPRWLLLAVLLIVPVLARAESTLNLGVFAFRPKPILAAQYQPLVDYLNQRIPHAHIRLSVLNQDEMEAALAKGELDLVFTNPSHYILLRHLERLTGAMATLVALEKDLPVSQLGGVILTQAGRDDITDLASLKGKRIAVPGLKFLGGYQAQAYECLKAGIDVPNDTRLQITGSHDDVVRGVLAGTADAGFIRTGIIEAMTREGQLEPSRVKIVNQQLPAGFPFLVSTRLYPEWAFAALPHVDEHIASQITRALLSIEPNSQVARSAGIHGFTIAADYLPVENLARGLRLPPFEAAPEFTPADVWTRYHFTLLASLGFAMVILALTTLLFVGNRRLRAAEAALKKNKAQLWALLDNTPDLMWLKDTESRFLAVNKAFVDSAGKSHAADVIGRTDFDLWPRELAQRYRQEDIEVMTSGRPKLVEAKEIHFGRLCWMEIRKTAILDERGKLLGTAGFAHDISHRREREQHRLAAELAHRDTLVREVHHRIKNNLQSVAGLLRRELGKHVELNPRLETAITQVYAIAVVHGLQSVDPAEATLLCDTLSEIVRTVQEQSQHPLIWRCDAGDRRLWGAQIHRDEAVALALVFNELLLNAIKHSPPGAASPEIAAEALPDGVLITIANPVASQRPAFDFAHGTGINTGLSLVKSLLPEQGVNLSYGEDERGWLVASLALGMPAITIKETA